MLVMTKRVKMREIMIKIIMNMMVVDIAIIMATTITAFEAFPK